MAKELIVSVNGREKKIAIIENEKVTEFYIERGETNQETTEGEQGGARRRGRRGRRRGRGADFEEPRPQSAQMRPEPEVINTPFVAADPSIQRIVDDEEAGATGEMFKDARVQERLLD